MPKAIYNRRLIAGSAAKLKHLAMPTAQCRHHGVAGEKATLMKGLSLLVHYI
jgi:hypothetical protein